MSRLRVLRFGANAVLYVVVVAFILILVNVLAMDHNLRFDTTEAGTYTLSPDTLRVLESLGEDIQVKAFFFEDSSRQRMERLLREMGRHTRRLQVDWIDPDREPAMVKAFEVRVAGTTVFVRGDRQARTTEITEGGVARALLELIRVQESLVCFAVGHGEPGLQDPEPPGLSLAREALERAGMRSREVELFRAEEVPPDCDALVVAGPKVAMLPEEVEAVGRLLEAGGRALLMLDPDWRSGLEPLLERYGVRLLPGIVIDANVMHRLAGYRADVPLASAYGDSEITRHLELATVYPEARALEVEPDAPGALRLVESDPESWVESDRSELATGEVGLHPDRDLPGPVALAVQISRPAGGGQGEGAETRLVVFGDSDFATNRYLNLLGNADLLHNTVSWLVKRRADLEIPPREPRPRLLALTGSEATTLMVLSVFVYPLTVLGIGVLQWLRRRKL
jgi:ABC-type uncharacterized transport system involved in gliding motility auxiliary subunit